MPRGKEEQAEQIIPYASGGRSRGGKRQDRRYSGQEDRCDGADFLVKRRSSMVASEKDFGQAAEGSREGE